MRNALILVVVVALVIVTAGAVNHSVAFDVDWVAGTWRAVSLLWIAGVIALVVLVAGLAAALLARRGAVRAQRKLETELDATYRRVRELESLVPAAAAAAVGPAGATSAIAAWAPEQTAVEASSASATATLAPEVASTTAAGAAQALAAEPPAVAETTVTVVAAHGSARVTQVLPLPDDPEAGDATAITRMPGDDAGPSSPAEPDAPAAEASAGETASPD